MAEDIQIELIQGADTGATIPDKVKQAYPKVNRNFQRMKARHLSLEGRVENIVANSGDSNTEIVDGRLNAEGTVHPTIGDNIRGIENKLTTQLADLMNYLSYMPVNGGDFDGTEPGGPILDGGIY